MKEKRSLPSSCPTTCVFHLSGQWLDTFELVISVHSLIHNRDRICKDRGHGTIAHGFVIPHLSPEDSKVKVKDHDTLVLSPDPLVELCVTLSL